MRKNSGLFGHAVLADTVAQIEKLCDVNEEIIRRRIAEGRPLPKLYESGLSFAPSSPVTCETLLTAESSLERRFADIEELVAWRVAELRVEGERAYVGAFQRVVPEGRRDSYTFVCVVRGDGKLEQPERAEHWKTPSRCRIRITGDRWVCLSAGCGAEGDVRGGRLHCSQTGTSIASTDATGPHPYVRDETCLFDRKRNKS